MDVDRGIMEEQYQKGIRQWRWWWSDRCYARARLLQSLRCSYNHIMLFVVFHQVWSYLFSLHDVNMECPWCMHKDVHIFSTTD